MSKENNKMQVDIDTLKKQNVNDLLSIKEIYSKLEELGEKITQVKYIDNTLVKKIKKEYGNLKKIILDENIQVKLDNKIDEFNIKLTNNIETINSQLTNDIGSINSQLDTIVLKEKMNLIVDFGANGNANFYDSNTKEYYEDEDFTILANDDTNSIKNAIKFSQEHDVIIEVPNANYKFTEQLLIDNKQAKLVSTGTKYKSIFIKCFNGDGIKITTNYCVLDGIRVNCSPNCITKGSGIAIGDDTTQANENIRANYCYIDTFCFGHGDHGIDCMKGNENTILGHYNQNKKDGVHCYSEWIGGSADWNANYMRFSAEGNARHGLNIYRSESNVLHAVCQGNGWGNEGGYGALINSNGNNGYIYAEGNVTGGVKFGTSGYGNRIDILAEGTKSKNPITYENYMNCGFTRITGQTSYFKMFRTDIKNMCSGGLWVNGPIPANSYKDFTINNIYGANTDYKTLIISPSTLLPQGLTYEGIVNNADTVTIRVHNNTNESITYNAQGKQWLITVIQ